MAPPHRYKSGANIALPGPGDELEIEAVAMTASDGGASRGVLYRRRESRPRVGVHLMHPRTDQSQNYNIAPLARAGYLVLGRAGRWVNNDIATEHERLLFDMAAGVRLLLDRGCEQVVLLGNSGGGTMAAFYQSQAVLTPADRLTHTAAGGAIDLASAELPPASGIMLVGAHSGEAACLAKWIDPSVIDEDDPHGVDASLDMYDPANGFVMPPQSSHFEAEFLARYRAGQRARLERLDTIARTRIAQREQDAQAARAASGWDAVRLERRASVQQRMLIQRTMADPAFVDLSIDPDDRVVSAYNNHPRPDLVNFGTGVAIVLTPEAWLSTWSGLSSHADTASCLAGVRDPLLVVHYCGDVITRVGEAARFFDASPAVDKQLVHVRHADHYGFTIGRDGDGNGTQGDRTSQGTDATVAWMRERFTP